MLESKAFIYSLGLLFLLSCTSHPLADGENSAIDEAEPQFSELADFQVILDSVELEGSILIFDSQAGTYYSNDFEWAQIARTPASTFKIANSIIALETAVVESDSSIQYWDGQPRRMSIWEKDMPFKEAFQLSCVPCYQRIAREIGHVRMSSYLDKLEFPGMQVSDTSIHNFWLEGNSAIRQMEWIEFLRRLHHSELNISPRTERIVKRMMIIDSTDQFVLRAKSGWAIRKAKNNGWFVGYLCTANNVFFFATNVNPLDKFDMKNFGRIRYDVTYAALRALDADLGD